jgi:hypothetical protein
MGQLFGIHVSGSKKDEFYTGDDEVLWDWLNAPVDEFPTEDGWHRVTPPTGYVFRGVVLHKKGEPVRTWLKNFPEKESGLLTPRHPHNDKAHLISPWMAEAYEKEFKNAGIPSERIFEAQAYFLNS